MDRQIGRFIYTQTNKRIDRWVDGKKDGRIDRLAKLTDRQIVFLD